mmetsp:Transcript_69872/g.221384  ORF Transcript_69872/g.221384 Transcript_69872/m.221384 type:complete len:426 (-) Transcript_69872:29-1306(-)
MQLTTSIKPYVAVVDFNRFEAIRPDPINNVWGLRSSDFHPSLNDKRYDEELGVPASFDVAGGMFGRTSSNEPGVTAETPSKSGLRKTLSNAFLSLASRENVPAGKARKRLSEGSDLKDAVGAGSVYYQHIEWNQAKQRVVKTRSSMASGGAGLAPMDKGRGMASTPRAGGEGGKIRGLRKSLSFPLSRREQKWLQGRPTRKPNPGMGAGGVAAGGVDATDMQNKRAGLTYKRGDSVGSGGGSSRPHGSLEMPTNALLRRTGSMEVSVGGIYNSDSPLFPSTPSPLGRRRAGSLTVETPSAMTFSTSGVGSPSSGSDLSPSHGGKFLVSPSTGGKTSPGSEASPSFGDKTSPGASSLEFSPPEAKARRPSRSEDIAFSPRSDVEPLVPGPGYGPGRGRGGGGPEEYGRSWGGGDAGLRRDSNSGKP